MGHLTAFGATPDEALARVIAARGALQKNGNGVRAAGKD
jgi:hypothetical protein